MVLEAEPATLRITQGYVAHAKTVDKKLEDMIAIAKTTRY